MSKIDVMFLESQMTALQKYADEKFERGCDNVMLYSDGSVDVDANGLLYSFDSILKMINDIDAGDFM